MPSIALCGAGTIGYFGRNLEPQSLELGLIWAAGAFISGPA